MVTFVNDTGVTAFDHIADEDTEIWTRFGVRSQPAFVFINDDGTYKTLTGRMGRDGIIEQIDLLAAS